MENIKNKYWPYNHWYQDILIWFKLIFVIIGIIIIFLISTFIYHHHKYKCIKGHYETSYDRWHNKDFIWQCDEEVLREDTTKHFKIENCNCR